MSAINLIDPGQDLEELLYARRQKTEQDRQAYKELVGSTVPTGVMPLIDVSRRLVEAKERTFGYFKDILDLKAAVSIRKKAAKNPQRCDVKRD
ncbi:MAG: hypothetical protein ACU83U_10960 [Gammaproteobacteria bacterium]